MEKGRFQKRLPSRSFVRGFLIGMSGPAFLLFPEIDSRTNLGAISVAEAWRRVGNSLTGAMRKEEHGQEGKKRVSTATIEGGTRAVA